jgi:AcrR family transcriptional regulator
MKPAEKQESGTRGQLLKSACKVFAEKGYREATIAEICEKAGANIAAVNYYFRDKESLGRRATARPYRFPGAADHQPRKP